MRQCGTHNLNDRSAANSSRSVLVLVWIIPLCVGCWAPLQSHAIPASTLPDEFRTPMRAVGDSINLAALTVKPPQDYQLGPGDVLDVTVPGLYDRSETTPLRVQVMSNGAIELPLTGAVQVGRYNLSEAQQAINKAYALGHLKNPTATITLFEKANTSVLVLGEVKQPGVHVLNKYENDVGHALATAGGLSQDAADIVEIHRHTPTGLAGNAYLWPRTCDPSLAGTPQEPGAVRKISLRVGVHQDFTERDITLDPGDVVVVPSRRHEVFYVVGRLSQTNTVRFTLGDRERELGIGLILPRDREIDVVTGVAMAGYIDPIDSPTTVTVHRMAPDGSPLLIRVDLIAARYNAKETILVRPGDIIYLNPDAPWYLRRTFDRVVPNLITIPYTRLFRVR